MEVDLFGQPDPFDVSFNMLGDENAGGFHAKVSHPIPLQFLSRQNPRPVFDIMVVQAASQVGGKLVHQITQASLLDKLSGKKVDVITHPNQSSKFSRSIIESQWDSEYLALNGQVVRALIDLRSLRYGEQGKFTDVVVVEEPDRCHIFARWAFGGTRGDVFFIVEMDNPRELRGVYRVDGREDEFWWNGGRH